MADDTTTKRSRILSIGDALRETADGPRRPLGPKGDFVQRREVDDIIGALHDLFDHRDAAVPAIQMHQEALLELVAAVQDLERRSLRGRIRRGIAWIELSIETLRGYGMELGLVKIPLAVPALPELPRPDVDNPEAMPKP